MHDGIVNINQAWARLIVEELARNGVRFCCVSPGSRSTPLALAAAACGKITVRVHFDERGAAFHALGHAAATRQPAALICTSGTATANYLPALIEAAQAHVPLIVLTADRPPELLDCGANQAVDQVRLYGAHIRWEALLPCPDARVTPEFVLSTVDQAVHRAMHAPQGPVHLNCMFREPLAPAPDGIDFARYSESLGAWKAGNRPYTQWERPVPELHDDAEGELLAMLGREQQGLLVVGRLDSDEARAAARRLAARLQWPVFADVTSGLRLGAGTGAAVAHYDALLLSEGFRKRCRPGTVLHVGGPLVSKRLIEHLASVRPAYVHVADHPLRQDPLHCVTRRVEADVAAFCRWVAANLPQDGNPAWLDPMQRADRAVSEALAAWERDEPALNEIAVARTVARLAPPDSGLFLGNSMPIRDMDAYADGGGPALYVAANRGASGIDGNIATAAGHAAARACPFTAVLGDLAVLHDLNSLALLASLRSPFALVAINNDGGGIFSFLPIAEHAEHFDTLFGTPHGMNFEHAARQFGLGYARPRDRASFERVYRDAFATDSPVLIEVPGDRAENLRLHRALQARLTAAADSACR